MRLIIYLDQKQHSRLYELRSSRTLTSNVEAHKTRHIRYAHPTSMHTTSDVHSRISTGATHAHNPNQYRCDPRAQSESVQVRPARTITDQYLQTRRSVVVLKCASIPKCQNHTYLSSSGGVVWSRDWDSLVT